MLRPTLVGAVSRGLVPAATRPLLGALLLALLATAASAQTYYVDPSVATCSAAATGTELDPYCSIAQAMALHKGTGVTIIVKPGIYRELVTVPATGAAGAPFVFQASGPGVVIDGADDFRQTALWTPSSGTTYRAASVTWIPVQVFVNGARIKAAPDTVADVPVNMFRYVANEGLYVNLGGSNPGGQQTFVGHRRYGFNVYSKNFIKISGFEIIRSEDRGILTQTGCSDIEISGNKVSFSGSIGIQTINGQRNVIRGNTVSDAAYHGIALTAGATNCVVSDNESFRNAHPITRVANGIYCYASPGNTIFGNRLHDNQDTGLQFSGGANNCLSYYNRSYKNGDHGYDHLGSTGVRHVNDIAYANYLDGFSFEGNSPGGSVYNSIAVDDGITNNTGRNLWVDAASSVGFTSDHNIFWNSTLNPVVKWIDVSYTDFAAYQGASGQDGHSKSASPLFFNADIADFHITSRSPAIDMAHSGIANWPALDITGAPRMDDTRTLDTGEGPVTYADIGLYEATPVDNPPVVVAPGNVKGLPFLPIQFNVTASDPDRDPITSFTMDKSNLPAGNNATFSLNPTNTVGTFRWTPGLVSGNYRVSFTARNSLSATADTKLQFPKRVTDEGVASAMGMPTALAFSNGFPNPSMGDVDFALDMPEAGDLDVTVYDAQGRVVYNEARSLPAGRHTVRWEGMTMSRQRAGTGIYFVRAKVAGEQFIRRIVRF